MNHAFGTLARIAPRTSAHRAEVATLGAVFLGVFALSSLVPFSADDWTWGSSIGWGRLDGFFDGYNGRYVGNLIVLLLSRVPFLVPLVIAAGVTFTLFLLLDLTDNRTMLGYGVTTILFLGMPVDVWRQSVVWMSGFVNYGLSGLAILVFLRAAKWEWYRPDRQPARPWVYPVSAVIGFASTLVMEHVTLYLVAASFVFLVLHRRRFRAVSRVGAVWFGSILVGAVVMFSNSTYRVAFGGHSNGYQHIDASADGSALVRILNKLADPISAYVAAQNVLVNVAVIGLVVLIVQARGDGIGAVAKRALLLMAVGYLVTTSTLRLARLQLLGTLEYKALSVLAAGLLLAVLGTLAAVAVQDGERRVQIIVGCASVVVLVAPLALVDPLNPRCFYPVYLVLLGLVSVLLTEVVHRVEALRRSRSLPLVAGAVALALYAPFFMAYWVAHGAAEDRISRLREAVAAGKDTVQITLMPFADLLHKPDPSGPFWDPRFKLFYELPEDLRIELVPPPPR
jgi:hypothetical protein